MTDTEVKAALDDYTSLWLTMYGEARGDFLEGSSSVEERIAVGCAVRNRLLRPKRFGNSYRAVCLGRAQFSCWWTWGGKSNYTHVIALARAMVEKRSELPTMSELEGLLMRETMFLAEGIIGGQIIDRTKGASHYYAPAAMVPRNKVPESAKGRPTLKIGSQLFYSAA